jgi:putative hemin transport protein
MGQHWNDYLALKAQEPHLFLRDAAERLGISEGALLLDAPESLYLGRDFAAILDRLPAVGAVLSVVRNAHAVLEKTAPVEKIAWMGNFGLAVNVGGFDVRLFTDRWKHALAFTTQAHGRTLRSIQFFDAYGLALQKIFLQEESHLPVWEAILRDFQQEKNFAFRTGFARAHPRDEALNAQRLAEFRQDWLELQDIHHFNGMLASYDISRRKAFSLAPQGHAFRLPPQTIERAYQAASGDETPIMSFVGNRGIVQIQTGKIHHPERREGWFNIFDQKETGFTLHLRDQAIHDVWMVCRPTRDGIVTCLEALDEQGDILLTLFGQRQEGERERASWRQIVESVTGQRIPAEPAGNGVAAP